MLFQSSNKSHKKSSILSRHEWFIHSILNEQIQISIYLNLNQNLLNPIPIHFISPHQPHHFCPFYNFRYLFSTFNLFAYLASSPPFKPRNLTQLTTIKNIYIIKYKITSFLFHFWSKIAFLGLSEVFCFGFDFHLLKKIGSWSERRSGFLRVFNLLMLHPSKFVLESAEMACSLKTGFSVFGSNYTLLSSRPSGSLRLCPSVGALQFSHSRSKDFMGKPLHISVQNLSSLDVKAPASFSVKVWNLAHHALYASFFS